MIPVIPRIMGDSTILGDIPLDVDVAAVYSNGPYAVTPAELEARFPSSRYGHAWIDVTGANPQRGWILDVETGDATPQVAAAWIAQWHKLHPTDGLPVLYCNRSNQSAVEQYCGKPGGNYLLGIATLDGTEISGPGIVFCQRDGANLTGGHWDRSLLFDPHLWLPNVPMPARPTLQQAVQAMTVIRDYIEGPQ